MQILYDRTFSIDSELMFIFLWNMKYKNRIPFLQTKALYKEKFPIEILSYKIPTKFLTKGG